MKIHNEGKGKVVNSIFVFVRELASRDSQ
jgi:hypothetical protein